MKSKVTLIKALDIKNPLLVWRALFRCEPPVRGHEYIVVSCADVPISGPETYVFPATAGGEITDFGKLQGSFRGNYDYQKAIDGFLEETPDETIGDA